MSDKIGECLDLIQNESICKEMTIGRLLSGIQIYMKNVPAEMLDNLDCSHLFVREEKQIEREMERIGEFSSLVVPYLNFLSQKGLLEDLTMSHDPIDEDWKEIFDSFKNVISARKNLIKIKEVVNMRNKPTIKLCEDIGDHKKMDEISA